MALLEAMKRSVAWLCAPCSKGQSTDSETVQTEYFTIATQYYVAGRYAYFAGLVPTAGNLFHHAIEMYLKGYLAQHMNELKRRSLGHSLKRCWRAFKRKFGDQSLNQHDKAIKILDSFESIRYPEKFAREGGEVHFSLTTPDPPSTGMYAAPASRRYDLVLNEIDLLVATIFQKANLNPKFFGNRLNINAQSFLTKENPSGIW